MDAVCVALLGEEPLPVAAKSASTVSRETTA